MSWLTVTSENVIDHCGDTVTGALPLLLPFIVGKTTGRLVDALDSSMDAPAVWACNTNHTHFIILDLGQRRRFTGLRGILTSGRSNIETLYAYVCDDPTVIGAPDLQVSDLQQSTGDPWAEYSFTPKAGRYV